MTNRISDEDKKKVLPILCEVMKEEAIWRLTHSEEDENPPILYRVREEEE